MCFSCASNLESAPPILRACRARAVSSSSAVLAMEDAMWNGDHKVIQSKASARLRALDLAITTNVASDAKFSVISDDRVFRSVGSVGHSKQ